MKKCAKSRNVPHKKLIEMTRRHRSDMTESENSNSKGDQLVANVRQTLKSHMARYKFTSSKKKHSRPRKKPKLHYSAGEEEQMTLALALSASLEVNSFATNVFLLCLYFAIRD